MSSNEIVTENTTIQAVLRKNSILMLNAVIFLIAIILISIGLSVKQYVVSQTGWFFAALGVFFLTLKMMEKAFNKPPEGMSMPQLEVFKSHQKSFRLFLVSIVLSWLPMGFMHVVLFNKRINYMIQDNGQSLDGKITDKSKVRPSELNTFKIYISVLYYITLLLLIGIMGATLTTNTKIIQIFSAVPLFVISVSIIFCFIIYRNIVVKMKSYTTSH